MGEADAVLREMLDVVSKLSREKRPPLKSVTMHPDDYDALRNHAAVVAVTPVPGGGFGWMHPLTIRGVPVYQSRAVPRGAPWFDPPEAGPMKGAAKGGE